MPRFCFLGHGWGVDSSYNTGWWFQFFLIIAAFWGNDQIWPMFFRWVETTNKNRFLLENFSSKAFRIFNSRICFFCYMSAENGYPPGNENQKTYFPTKREVGALFFSTQVGSGSSFWGICSFWGGYAKTPLLGGSSQDLDTWLISMVIISPLAGVIPSPNGHSMAYKWWWS